MNRRIEDIIAIVLGFMGFLGLLGSTEGSSLLETLVVKIVSLCVVLSSIGYARKTHPSLWNDEEI